MIITILRTLILGVLLALANPAFAAASAQLLGYTLGEATHDQVRASLQERGANPTSRGTSTHSGGPMLDASGRALGLEGLQSALLLFDVEQRLSGGLLTMNKSRYDAVVQALKGKYTMIREDRPFVGNRRAEFRAGDVLVTVDAPHMSFEMTVLYRTTAVQKSMDRANEADAERRRQTDRDQF